MTGRKPNGSGYVRRTQLADGELRFEARLRNRYLGSFPSRAAAQARVDEQRALDAADEKTAKERA